MDACAKARRRGHRLYFHGTSPLTTATALQRYSSIFLLFALLVLAMSAPVQAAMSLNRTRLVVTAVEREATIDIRSEDPSPILLKRNS